MKAERIISVMLFLLNTNCFTQTWGTLGSGFNYSGVEAMCVYKNELCVSGYFSSAGGLTAKSIARWNGTNWDSLGSGLDWGPAFSLTHSDSMLYAGGSFQSAGNIPNTYHAAGWDGTKWVSFGSNYMNGNVFVIKKYKNDLYAGGKFTLIGSLPVNRIARWNGTVWSNMSGGVTGGFIPQVTCMAIYNGELYVGGDFTFAGGKPANNIARWNGASWDSVGSGFDNLVTAMFVDTINNLLYVSGGFTTAGGIPVNGWLAKWDGTNWSGVGNPPFIQTGASSFAMYRNKLFIGCLSPAGSYTDTLLVSWDGTTWKRIEGPNNGIQALQVYNDKLYLGGGFDKIYDSIQGLLFVNYIASYWEPPAGVNEIENYNLKIFPNPAKNNITIETEENKNFIVRITNPLGQKIAEKAFQKKTEVDVSDFGKGLFLVEVCDEKGVKCHTEKVLIE